MLLAKKDSDEQVLLAEDQAWIESISDSDQKSMQTWSSWLKLKRFFQIQTKFLHLLKKSLLRMCDLFDENNLFIFDDKSVRISPVSKMHFRKKLCDSMNFLGTVRFGNNDSVVIAGYGDVVIGSMTIKKVYFVEGL
nr:hypothetical protein [Tanacetum cinerariifolium]